MVVFTSAPQRTSLKARFMISSKATWPIVPGSQRQRRGDSVAVSVEPAGMHVFDRDSGRSLAA